MSVTLLVPKPDTPQRRLQASEYHPKTHGRLPGGRLADQVALNQMVQVCPGCRHLFDARAARYERWRRETYIMGLCDACQRFDAHCTGFITQRDHDLVGEWSRPRKGRWIRSAVSPLTQWWASRTRPRSAGTRSHP